MVEALAVLVAAQCAGALLAALLPVPLPGPVVGMLLLFAAWPALAPLHAALDGVADTLHRQLGLLFVPVCAGVAQHGPLLAAWWLPVGLALAASTLATLTVVAWVFVPRAGLAVPPEPGRA